MAYESFEQFNEARARGQSRLEACDHLGVKRLLALDRGAYQDASEAGGLTSNTKELLGLVASTVLRCDDCITYHLERCAEAGWSTMEIEDAFNVAMVVGGTITIPHIRRALLLLDDTAPNA